MRTAVEGYPVACSAVEGVPVTFSAVEGDPETRHACLSHLVAG